MGTEKEIGLYAIIQQMSVYLFMVRNDSLMWDFICSAGTCLRCACVRTTSLFNPANSVSRRFSVLF